MIQEKQYRTFSGYLMLTIHLILLAAILFLFVSAATHEYGGMVVLAIILLALWFFSLIGYFINNPNQSKVLLLFGDYMGTARETGFRWTNPFFTRPAA